MLGLGVYCAVELLRQAHSIYLRCLLEAKRVWSHLWVGRLEENHSYSQRNMKVNESAANIFILLR